MKLKRTIQNEIKKAAKQSQTPKECVESTQDFINRIIHSKINGPTIVASDTMIGLTWSNGDKLVSVKFTSHGHFQYIRIKTPDIDFSHGLAAYHQTVDKILPKIEPHIV